MWASNEDVSGITQFSVFNRSSV